MAHQGLFALTQREEFLTEEFCNIYILYGIYSEDSITYDSSEDSIAYDTSVSLGCLAHHC